MRRERAVGEGKGGFRDKRKKKGVGPTGCSCGEPNVSRSLPHTIQKKMSIPDGATKLCPDLC